MKQMNSFFVALLFVVFSCVNINKATAYQDDYISMQTFYDELSPYGSWFNDPDYGYVWSPAASRNFRPYYTDGHWAMTQYGNTWVSNYEWGWAPFHYGRWTYDNNYGWLWIPGYEWAPAWVTWRSGGGYYGWAPLGPNSNYNYAYDDNYYVPDFWWIFIPNNFIYSNNYYSCWRGPRYNNRFIYRSRVMHNCYNNYYACGPFRNEIEHNTGRNITIYNLRNEHGNRRPRMTTNSIGMYQPKVNQTPRSSYNQTEMPKSIRQFERPIQKTEVAMMNHDIRSDRNMAGDRNDYRNNNRSFDNQTPADQPIIQNDVRNNQVPDKQPRNDFGNRDNRFDKGGISQQSISERNQDWTQNQARNNPQQTEKRNQSSIQNNTPQVEWRRPEPQRVEQTQQQLQPRVQEQNFQQREMPRQERQYQQTRSINPPVQRNSERGIQQGFRR